MERLVRTENERTIEESRSVILLLGFPSLSLSQSSCMTVLRICKLCNQTCGKDWKFIKTNIKEKDGTQNCELLIPNYSPYSFVCLESDWNEADTRTMISPFSLVICKLHLSSPEWFHLALSGFERRVAPDETDLKTRFLKISFPSYGY